MGSSKKLKEHLSEQDINKLDDLDYIYYDKMGETLNYDDILRFSLSEKLELTDVKFYIINKYKQYKLAQVHKLAKELDEIIGGTNENIY